MVICPQVLQAGASLCMLFAAAFMASKPASAFLTVAFTGFKDSASGVFVGLPGTTRTSLNGGVFFILQRCGNFIPFIYTGIHYFWPVEYMYQVGSTQVFVCQGTENKVYN